MQDDDIACLDVVGEDGVSILPPFAVSVFLNRTERGTEHRHPAEHRVQAVHQALQRLAQLQERSVRSHPVVMRRAQTVLERVRGGFLCRNGGYAPDGPAGQPLGCAPADRVPVSAACGECPACGTARSPGSSRHVSANAAVVCAWR